MRMETTVKEALVTHTHTHTHTHTFLVDCEPAMSEEAEP